MEYFMGIDIGTSSVRAVVFDRDGKQVSLEAAECTLKVDVDGTAEVDPDEVFGFVCRVVSVCLEKWEQGGKGLSGIGLSCHMHSLLAVDGKGKPLTGALTWADKRAVEEADQITKNYDSADLYNRTGCRVQHPMYPISKLLWLKKNRQDIFNKTAKFITIKEYVLFKLFGEFTVDFTLAASQGYFNIHRQDWDDGILQEVLGIGRDRLGQPVECTHVFKGMTYEAAELMGLNRDIPIVIGSGDGIMANLGCGVCDDTALSSTVGTSGAIRTTVHKPLLDPEQRTWCYSFTREAWVAGGAINNGGIVLKWLRETFKQQFESDAVPYGDTVYRLFDRFASEISPGSNGLIFLPYLTGERSPDWNAGVRGLMYGLDIAHGKKHMVRAAMEGVMYRMYSVYQAMSSLNGSIRQIRANGGYVKSDIWLRIQADIFNKEIVVPAVDEASALGAAYICMVSLGALEKIGNLLPVMEPQRVISPDAGNHEIYRTVYKQAMDIYTAIYK